MKIFNGLAGLAAAAGVSLGTTDWVEVDQERIDQFADATGDHQWIHVDAGRAAQGPFGSTIAHGLLTLSLLPVFLHRLYQVEGVSMAVNYGLDKVRFPAPVPVGAKLRATSTITEVTPLDGAVQLKLSTVIEIEGGAKPACVVESVVRYLG
ncbi:MULTISPECIES: MaoC family dehydratase [unclassified Streptomyces]|uniref:MaoC family dehydratase n=1 Tax=unclassified Streptomyces TaxID=2593676 RepID=UPI002E79C177|nr:MULTISPECIES: MaoC family dehydratase [unclassified Streptomyces]MEE1764900.1 MaoC family dehydratase [Streptomyces sp. SP18BB07]MEE1831685.1 MaoC family dehydratase [Streptomyces sp. SP17KL33]